METERQKQTGRKPKEIDVQPGEETHRRGTEVKKRGKIMERLNPHCAKCGGESTVSSRSRKKWKIQSTRQGRGTQNDENKAEEWDAQKQTAIRAAIRKQTAHRNTDSTSQKSITLPAGLRQHLPSCLSSSLATSPQVGRQLAVGDVDIKTWLSR